MDATRGSCVRACAPASALSNLSEILVLEIGSADPGVVVSSLPAGHGRESWRSWQATTSCDGSMDEWQRVRGVPIPPTAQIQKSGTGRTP